MNYLQNIFSLNRRSALLIAAAIWGDAGTGLNAQTYPSSVLTILTGPRTLFLDEYADPFQPRIRATVFFTDHAAGTWEFALKLKITGPGGIVITTKPGMRPLVPLQVNAGQPYVVEGTDLAFYFDYNHLDFTGISRAQLEATHRLPEGYYTFCFEAVDYETGRPLSHAGCTGGYLTLSDPPVILYPQPGAIVENVNFQNIFMQWQLANPNAVNMASSLKYKIELYEVNNQWTNPNTAILNNQALPVWQSPALSGFSALYGLAEPVLTIGRRYVWTVRAVETSGRSSFKNNGISKPSWFRFGYHENDTIPLTSPLDDFQFTLSTASEFSWQKPPRALTTQMVSYTLKLVEIANGQSPDAAILYNLPFFQQTYLATANVNIVKTIPVTIWANIKRMGRYAWQVTATSGNQQVAKSAVNTFTGPPEIESFIAGGFLMKVTRVNAYDQTLHKISGRCKTTLFTGWPETEFAFSNIYITPIGNNEWVMVSGTIADAIACPPYTLQPMTHVLNGIAEFDADSVFVNTSGLKLGGKVGWICPHPGSSLQMERLTGKRCRLSLANGSFHLMSADPIQLDRNYRVPLLEPSGFELLFNQSSALAVYQSKYEFLFNGFVRLPASVKIPGGQPVHIRFADARQVHYINMTDNEESDALAVARNVSVVVQPLKYTVDLSDTQSPAEFAAANEWKGVHIERARVSFPTAAEHTGQLRLFSPRDFTVVNSPVDTVSAHIGYDGLHLNAAFSFVAADSLKFNGFPSTNALFHVKTVGSEIQRAGVTGQIHIPFIDTVGTFPYRVELGEFGFNEGYLSNGLTGRTFTFNASGTAEQRVKMQISRALFRERNRLELDLSVSWPYFGLQLNDVSSLCVWGNGNIGFDKPNGTGNLRYPASGKLSGFAVQFQKIGCGRDGNAYGFGVSGEAQLDEEITGENGAPIINAYSIYKNPLLTGTMQAAPVSTVTAGLTGQTPKNFPVYQSSTPSFTETIASGVSESLSELGFLPADTLTASNPFHDQQPPLVSGNSVLKLQQAIDILYRLKPFISSDAITNREWLVLDKFRNALNASQIEGQQFANVKAMLNYVLNKVIDGLIKRIEQPIQDISNQATGKVRAAVNDLAVKPINDQITSSLNHLFLKMQQQLTSKTDEQYHDAIESSIATVNAALAQGIRNSVMQSFEKNVTVKFTGIIERGVTAKVKQFVRREVAAAGSQLIANGAGAPINLGGFLQNAGALLAGVADTVKAVIVHTNSTAILNTAESLVIDAIAGINWNDIANRILTELIGKGISAVVANQISQNAANAVMPYVAGMIAMVKFDFNGLGKKLQNGQFDGIVKFDPTLIYITSPTADVRGMLRFTKADPVYGDSWKGNVMVRVKVPRKENPVECEATMVNGKTAGENGFTYWFVKLEVGGLNVSLLPTPLVWDGCNGHFFSKMKKTFTGVTPDNTNKWGVGASFRFYDLEMQGGLCIFDVGAEYAFNTGGFGAQLTGEISALNYAKLNGKYRKPGIMTGNGTFGYYKTPECNKVAANFNVKLNTEPVLCAGGNLGLDFRTPTSWSIWAGTPSGPMSAKLMCMNFLTNQAYFAVDQSGYKAGFIMQTNISATTPWLELSGLKIRGSSSVQMNFTALSSMQWMPAFKLNDASVSASAQADVKVEYETSVNTGTVTVAGIGLSGNLTYKSEPDAELHGSLNGQITILNYALPVQLPVHYSLSKKQIIN